MTRLASRPPWGPAASSSEPTLPALAASELAPEESAPPFAPTSVDCEAPGFGFLLAQPPALTNAVASIRTMSIFRIPISTLPPVIRLIQRPLLSERSPGGFPHLALLRFQSQSDQSVHGDGGQDPAAALALRIHDCTAVGRKARRLIEVSLRQHPESTAVQVLDCDTVVATIQRHHRQLIAVR